MRNSLAEEDKEVIADMLGYYGFKAETDYEMPFLSDSIDIAAMKDNEEYPRAVIFCSPDKDILKFISRIAKHSSIEDVIVLDSTFTSADKSKLPGNVHFFAFPDIDHTKFEDFISSISARSHPIPYFSTVSRNPNSSNTADDALHRFDALIGKQGLDIEKARYEIYRTAVSGMNIRYGRYIQADEGKPALERNKELSREAILLKAAGYLREEKLPDRGLGLDSDGESFLVLSDEGESASLAQAIVDDYVHSQNKLIKRIMSAFPKTFSYVAIVGSLGYYAPKTTLSIERHRKSWSGIIRTTVQSENSYLLEVIRTMINTVGLTEEEWNRINCLSSFGEINELMGNYFGKFEKARVGVYGYRGLKRIYIPAKRISVQSHLSAMHDDLDWESLEEFCIYDSILRSNRSGFDFRSVISNMDLDNQKLVSKVEKLAELGYCSKLLPENSDLPIAIYNQSKFNNFCLRKMREMASRILEIEW